MPFWKIIFRENLNQSNFYWLNQWFAFSLIHQLKNIFHCSISWLSLIESVEKIISLLNQLIFTDEISGIWLIYSNLFLAIWISQISLIISRFWLIHIQGVNKWKNSTLRKLLPLICYPRTILEGSKHLSKHLLSQ